MSFGAALRQLFRMRNLCSSIPVGFGSGEREGASSFFTAGISPLKVGCGLPPAFSPLTGQWAGDLGFKAWDDP